MNRTTIQVRNYLALALLAAAPKLMAQAAPQPAAAPVTETAEDTITLDPFSVSAGDSNDGYQVKDTLAGTRIRTDLRDVASSLTVVNAQFLQDTGAKNTQDLLVYTTNTEVGGVRGNFSGAGGSQTYSESASLLRPNNNTRVRGLDAADNTRDYFLTEIPWDGYIVDRVDMQRGPNSILFGVGSPAGIINTSLNSASFKKSAKFENRLGGHGSMRNSFDYNTVILKNELAVRLAGVHDDEQFQQRPAFQKSQRIYGAVRYEPKLFGPESKTSIRVNYEHGKIDANRPRQLPPVDAITPWFATGTDAYGYKAMNRLTVDGTRDWTRLTANKELQPGTTNEKWVNGVAPWYSWAGMGRQGNSSMSLRYNATSTDPIQAQTSVLGTSWGLNSAGQVDGTIGGVQFGSNFAIAGFNAYAKQVLGAAGAYYGNKSLSDPSVFDFYHKLMDGPNKKENAKWSAANFAVSQSFLSQRLGFEFVYDYQRYQDGQIGFLNGGEYVLSVDINSKLLDGSNNPNVGRAYVGNSGQYGNNKYIIDRDSLRFTAFGDLRTEDFFGKNLLTQILGHHVVTAVLSQDIKRTDYRGYARWATDTDFATASHQAYDLNTGASQVDWIAYLGPSMSNMTSASGANLSNVSAVISPRSLETLRFFDSKWSASNVAYDAPYTYVSYTNDKLADGPIGGPVTNTGVQADNPANYVGWKLQNFRVLNAENGDIDKLWTDGQKGRNKIKSQGFTWQGYLLDGVFVPVVGWRKDTVTNSSTTAPSLAGNVKNMNYSVDTSAANTLKVTGESKSFGGVLHMPKSWSAKMPARTSMSLFANQSENFKADAPRGDLFGQQIANPSGKTTDYGFVVSTLDERLTVKVTRYETKIKNATLQADSAGFGNNLYYAWAIPYWGATHALAALDGIASPQRRQGNWGWPWNGIEGGDATKIRAAARDFFVNFPLSQAYVNEYGLGLVVDKMHVDSEASWYQSVPGYGNGTIADGGSGASNLGLQPRYAGKLGSFGDGPKAYGDTTSKGYELEVNAQITKNWNIAANASKTNASRTSIAPSIDQWVDTYTKFLAGPAGQIRMWGGDTFAKAWNDNIISPYKVLKAQLGQQAPEVAKWRFNAVTNYNFSNGLLKGSNAGLAYRWEGKRVLGYQYSSALNALDVSKPWESPVDQHVDLWVGYGRKLTSKIDWRIQLNLRNVGEKNSLVPVNINPDGKVALSRIQEGMSWTLTNTFNF